MEQCYVEGFRYLTEFGGRNCGTMLKDWVAGGNCASWPRKKGGKRAATKIPQIGQQTPMDADNRHKCWSGS